MRSRILIALFLLLGILSSCRREGRIIPRSRMTEIYVEMFVADQRIASSPEIRRTADTSWVYEPIFEKYGYNSDDYRASVAHYMKDPDRYARILRESGAMIERHLKELRKEKKRLEMLEQMKEQVEMFNPERIYRMTSLGNPGIFREDSVSYYVDTAGGELYFDPREWMDTAFYGPVLHVDDSVSVRIDSLTASSDTQQRVDSLRIAPDSTKKEQPKTKQREIKQIKPEKMKMHRGKIPVREIEEI